MSDPEVDRFFRGEILPTLGTRGGVGQDCRWIFVCGQQGSGKSTFLRRIEADPGTGFDLNQSSDPGAGRAWITRLRADLNEILSGPAAEPSRPSLAVSCDRLIALVRQVAGLPT